MDYKNAKIYKILNYVDDKVYVGSTCQALSKRMQTHRAVRNTVKKKERPLYKHMNAIGVENFYIELVEDYPCDRKEQLRAKEGQWIRQIGTLNKQIAGQTKEEYYQDNKQVFLDKAKVWAKNNPDKAKAAKQKYKETHKEQLKAIINCECGGSYQANRKARHFKCQKHITFMQGMNK